jgi:hypothetical protein
MDRNTIITIVGLIVAVWAWRQYATRNDLPEDGTVVDYRAASSELRGRWLDSLCLNGKCLSSLAIECGFDNGPQECVDRCFNSTAESSVSYEKLDTIRKYCGSRCSVFLDQEGLPAGVMSRRDVCEEHGGRWGGLPDVPQPVRK